MVGPFSGHFRQFRQFRQWLGNIQATSGGKKTQEKPNLKKKNKKKNQAGDRAPNFFQKKRDVHKLSARNSGAGNGCANFMGAWHFLVLSAGKPHAHKIPPFRGGSGFFRRGGGTANFIFMGARNFLILRSLPNDNKISDNKICKISKLYCHGFSQEKKKTVFWTIFRNFSPSPTPSKTQILLILSFRRLRDSCPR